MSKGTLKRCVSQALYIKVSNFFLKILSKYFISKVLIVSVVNYLRFLNNDSPNQKLELNIQGNELDVVQKKNYLGVQIDCCLDWKEKMKAVSTKVSTVLGFFKYA